MTISISSALACLRRSASSLILARRPEVPATCFETSTRDWRSILETHPDATRPTGTGSLPSLAAAEENHKRRPLDVVRDTGRHREQRRHRAELGAGQRSTI